MNVLQELPDFVARDPGGAAARQGRKAAIRGRIHPRSNAAFKLSVSSWQQKGLRAPSEKRWGTLSYSDDRERLLAGIAEG